VSALVIRAYQDDDEADVLAVWAESFAPGWAVPRDEIRWKCSVQRDLFLVGVLDGRVIATAMGGYDGHRGWLYKLAVGAAYRRRGVGRRMVEAVEQRLKARGCPKVNLQVLATNRDVVAFYQQLGFAIEDRVSMGRRLA